MASDVVAMEETDPTLAFHSIRWEARALATILLELGLAVDVIDTKTGDVPIDHPPYKAMLFLHNDLYRHKAALRPETVKIALLTGSNPKYQNRRERERILAMQRRRLGAYSPQRQVADEDQELWSYRMADHRILVGNRTTLETYPEELRSRLTLVDVTATWPLCIKPAADHVPEAREFLWFGGLGAVLKGLDLVLEVFAAHPNWILNVVGGLEAEFTAIYSRELNEHPRIRFHGLLQPGSPQMQEIARRCFAFIMPSASEGMSGSVATCLCMGLYPIISIECGIDLPAGGTMLQSCSIDEIRQAAEHAYALPDATLAGQIDGNQREALNRFSRAAFIASRRRLLSDWIGSRGSQG